jgi:site-specific DNA recombinase
LLLAPHLTYPRDDDDERGYWHLSLLLADLCEQGIVTRVRTLKSGAKTGGIPFTRGPLAHLLRNRFYIGEVIFKGEVLAGEQPAIVDRDLFDAVQAKLTEQVNNHNTARMKSEALLAGRLFDDRGNRMTPSHVSKRGIKYRYYLSSALLQGQPERAGGVSRIPAAEIEGLVTRSVREHLNQFEEIEDAVLISTRVGRVEVRSDRLVIELTNAKRIASKRSRGRNVLKVSWHKTPLRRRREILVPASVPPQHARAIRSENRALLIASIARGRRWLNELVADPTANAQSIATRDGCSARKVNMTISLAFLAPDLVKAAIEGRLPHGMGVVRLADLPAEWSRQHQMLGLPAQ